MKRARPINHPRSEKLICIKISQPPAPEIIQRVPRSLAADIVSKHDNVTYTSKSKYHRYLQKGGLL